MIYSIPILILAFSWLGYETDWMRVRLLVGNYGLIPPPLSLEQRVKQQRKWQFLKYGDGALVLCRNCRYGSGLTSWRTCPKDRWFGWEIPARTVKAFGSTMNFNKGCNYQRARLLRDIAKAQKSKATAHYPISQSRTYVWLGGRFEPSIDISVDGECKLSVNGDYKHGIIRTMMRQHCVPGEGKIRLVKVR